MKYIFKMNFITAMCFLLCACAFFNRVSCVTPDLEDTWEATVAKMILQEDSGANRMKLSNLFSKFGVGSEKELQKHHSVVSWKEVSNLNDICEMNGTGNIGGVRIYVNTIQQSSEFVNRGSSNTWDINKSNVSVITLINAICNKLKPSFFCEVGINFNTPADIAENSMADMIKDFILSGCGKRLEGVSGVFRDAIWTLLSVGTHSEWVKMHLSYLGMENKSSSPEWGVGVSNALDDELKAMMIDNATINKNEVLVMVSEPTVVRGIFRNRINPRIMLWKLSFILDIRLPEKELASIRDMVKDGLKSLKTLIKATAQNTKYPPHVFCAAYGPLFNDGREIIS